MGGEWRGALLEVVRSRITALLRDGLRSPHSLASWRRKASSSNIGLPSSSTEVLSAIHVRM